MIMRRQPSRTGLRRDLIDILNLLVEVRGYRSLIELLRRPNISMIAAAVTLHQSFISN